MDGSWWSNEWGMKRQLWHGWRPPAKYANGAVFRLWATYLPTFPGVVPVVIPELERPGGLSFPLRLRGSGSLALLFHASIRLIMWSFITIVRVGCQGMMR
jgi:hypothetical protein